MKEYLIKPSDTEEEVLVNRYAYAIFDMKEYMRKCGLQEDEIDKGSISSSECADLISHGVQSAGQPCCSKSQTSAGTSSTVHDLPVMPGFSAYCSSTGSGGPDGAQTAQSVQAPEPESLTPNPPQAPRPMRSVGRPLGRIRSNTWQ